MTRREAREELFKLVYEKVLRSETAEEIYNSEAVERDLKDKYIKECFFGIFENEEEIDALISENARGWKISRLSKINLAIIRISVYEMLYANIPVSISINEAVELSKKYGEDSAPSFVNGILNTIAKQKGLK
jgi:N utilization substance protein B